MLVMRERGRTARSETSYVPLPPHGNAEGSPVRFVVSRLRIDPQIPPSAIGRKRGCSLDVLRVLGSRR